MWSWFWLECQMYEHCNLLTCGWETKLQFWRVWLNWPGYVGDMSHMRQELWWSYQLDQWSMSSHVHQLSVTPSWSCSVTILSELHQLHSDASSVQHSHLSTLGLCNIEMEFLNIIPVRYKLCIWSIKWKWQEKEILIFHRKRRQILVEMS